MPVADRPAYPRPFSLPPHCVKTKQLSTASGSRSEALSKGRWPRGRIPRPAGPTLQWLNLRLSVDVKHTDYTCLQLTHLSLPTLEHYK